MGSFNLTQPLQQVLQKKFSNTVMVEYQTKANLGETSFSDYENQVRGEIKKYPHVVLVGHSMGGLLAERLLNEPQVMGAVLMAPSPAVNLRTSLSASQTLKFLPYLPQFAYAYYFHKPMHYPNRLTRSALFTGLPEDQAEAYIKKMSPESGLVWGDIFLGKSLVVSSTTKPVFCMFGALDKNLSPEAQQKVTGFYKATAKIYPSHHFFYLGHEAEVAKDISAWLSTSGISEHY